MINSGTRTRNNLLTIAPPQGSITRTLSNDLGLSKQSGAAPFTFGSGRVTGANGSFPGFVVGDVIQVEGTNLNNGFFTVTGIDTVNRAFLTLSPPPKTEAGTAAYVRSA
jgi:hypothetical protein